jgi:hypothetical protein
VQRSDLSLLIQSELGRLYFLKLGGLEQKKKILRELKLDFLKDLQNVRVVLSVVSSIPVL